MIKYTLNIERLKKQREQLNISKVETARRIGISQPAYLRYESGERTPSFQMMEVIANVLNTSVDYLTGITDSPLPDTVIVRKKNQPELFALIDCYNKMNTEQCKRIQEYIRQLQHISD